MSTTATQSAQVAARGGQVARRVLVAVLASAAIASLLLAVLGLQGVTKQIAGLSAGWLAAAVALELGSCLAFVVTFRLFFDGLPPGPARELALTEQGAGALLPGGGVGALAIGGWLLRREGLSMQHIVERSSALVFLTSATNIAALIGAGALLAAGLLAGPHDLLRTGLPVLVGLVVTVVVPVVPPLVRRSPRARRTAWLLDPSPRSRS
jgi:hypothetical protein